MNDCYLNFLVSFRALFSLDVGANLVNSKQTIGIILPDLSLLGYAVPVESFGIGLFVILFAYLIIEYNVQLLSHEKFKIAMNMLHTAHTPLILLRNQLEELKTGNLPEPLSQQVEEALGYAECIIYCNRNIATLNKVNKRIPPKTSTVNLELSTYVTSIVNQCRAHANSRQIRLTVGECSDCVSCRINENIMTAALQHLINKMILISESGCCISINVTHTMNSWQLQISNNEIAGQRAGKMFPFIPIIFPVYGYSDLWTVRKIIRLHGGKITGCRHGKAATFQIVIPTDCHCQNQSCPVLKHSSAKTKTQIDDSCESPKSDKQNTKARETSHILLVMADKLFSDYLKKTLSRYFQISVLDNPELLINTAISQNPDAIIIDDNVNGISGDTLSTQIKENKMMGYIPIILLLRTFDSESYLSRFFLNWYIANCNVGSKPEDITSSDFYKSMTTKSAVGVNDSEYQNISVYKYVLTHECMQAFYTCMNNLHDLYEQIIPKDVNNEKLNICTLEVNKFFNPYWKDVITEDENNKESRLFYFIPKYIEENILTTITQQQRIVFHAVCVYLERCNKVDIEKLKDWMHFVWNIVENSYIDREQVVSAIRFFERDLDSLPHDSVTFAASQDIFLAKIDPTQIKEVFGKRQLLEEISKAKKIDEDYCWKKKIHEAESFAFFNGSIAFLFNDIEGRMDDWGNFDQKMSVAKTLFDENGVKEERVVMALQTLYSYCSDWIRQLWWNARIFDGTSSTWKNNILNSVDRNYTYIYACPVHHILMGDNPSEVLHEYRSMRMLTDKALIEYIVKKNEQKREMYIRWPHDALYFCGDKRGVLLSNKFRDDSIAKLLNDGRFSLNDESIKIANTGLLWGFDINLVYHLGNGHDINLQWYREHNANNYDIYLMDENWNYRHRLNNLDNAEGDRRYYFCFNVIKETEDFIFTFIKQLKSEFAEILNGE